MAKTPGLYAVCVAIVFMAGCHTQRGIKPINSPCPKSGNWALRFNLGDATLPVAARIDEKTRTVYIQNAEEEIACTQLVCKKDSVFFSAPVFDNIFKGKLISSTRIEGTWYNLSKKNYSIPFTAVFTGEKKFQSPTVINDNENQTWEVWFSPGTSNQYKAIGVFHPQTTGGLFQPNNWQGTFMTETGDYRYLSGYKRNDSLMLAGFDGSHVFLFRAAYYSNGDSLQGTFYSGNHWSEPWIAGKNPKVSLTNPDSLTRMVHADSTFHFSFPDLTGKKVSYPSAAFTNKVTIIQIMGSWCPNCMDETRYLVDVYNKYHNKGVEMVSLCFERSDNFYIASKQVQHMKESLDATYPFLIAGTANKGQAVKKLPMLNHIMSFPTTVYLDRKGKVRKIYTGFYGPSTGKYHERFVEANQRFIEKLLAEP